jgi:hypothetical protein
VNSRDIVAIILAMAVLIFVLSGTALRGWLFGQIGHPPNVESTQAWKDIINVILGALSGYIAGKSSTNGDKG